MIDIQEALYYSLVIFALGGIGIIGLSVVARWGVYLNFLDDLDDSLLGVTYIWSFIGLTFTTIGALGLIYAGV